MKVFASSSSSDVFPGSVFIRTPSITVGSDSMDCSFCETVVSSDAVGDSC